MTRSSRTRGVLLAAAIALAPAAALAAGDGGQRIAVLATSSGVPDSAAAAVERAMVEAVRQAGVNVAVPEDVARAVASAKADVATCATNAACAAAACGSLGADALLASSVRDIGSGWLIEMRLREGRRGSLRGGSASAVPRDERAAREAADKLARHLVQQVLSPGAPAALGPTASAKPPSADAGKKDVRPQEPSPSPAPGAEKPARDGEGSLAARPEAAPAQRLSGVRVAAAAGETPASRRHRWGLVVACTGAALLAGGASAGAIAWTRSGNANALLAIGSLDGYAIERNEARTLAWAGVGLGGAGAAALAAGAWLRLGGRSPAVSLDLEPGFAGARLALAF